MSAQAQRIAIAEACGWAHPSVEPFAHPDYPHDLNAMHEAEKVLSDTAKREYIKALVAVVNESEWSKWPTAHATSTQRAEAFLRTIGRWKE